MQKQPAEIPTHESTRISYFDSLRAIAIIAVLVLHVAAWNWYRFPVDSAEWEALNWIDSTVRFAVPIFFMISGALFLNPSRVVTVDSIFRRSIPRIVTAFMFWSVFYALVMTFGPGGSGSIRSMIGQMIVGHYHLWFLIALLGLYIVTPLLRKIAENKALAWYFVGLATIFASVLPLAVNAPAVGQLLGTVLETMKLEMVLGYSLYFVLGYLLSEVRLSKLQLRGIVALGAVGIAITALGTSWISVRAEEPIATFYGYMTPNVVLASTAAFLVAKVWGEGLGSRRIIRFLSKNSFGIFLVHPLFQWGYMELGITTAFAHPIISVPALTLLILLPSALATLILRKIPKVGKYIA